MDEMKLKLSSQFLRNIAAKIIRKVIKSKFGYDLDIDLNDLIISYKDGKARLILDVEADIEHAEFTKMINQIDLE